MTDADVPASAGRAAKVKCLVWDLDETLWIGTLLEGGANAVAPETIAIIKELDARGILQSIASKNDYEVAWQRLTALGIADYFLCPQIGWGGKADSLKAIADTLGIGINSLAFVDDQAAERDEVAFFLPQVLVLDAAELAEIPDRVEFTPSHQTAESSRRRQMYQADLARQTAEAAFEGPRDEFLARLNMQMTVRRAEPGDLERAGELTLRTSQLNSTGITFSIEELDSLSQRNDHLLLVAELDDIYGHSGVIGLALIETSGPIWTIRLLIMSCRVLTRGVGTVMLGQILRRAKQKGAALVAEFVPTDRNRQMLITYKFAGFRQESQTEQRLILRHELARIASQPGYVRIIDDELGA